ncbi:PREDICTED: uncharacterized protein LOC108379878 isoform X2 [Rhagoletis zephyria]|uniref:uncharacterized protein LOC108379878 isoform X2 n=1 Tax=Rhagoletis zephyria TaxID=28612 RepID=UPI000811748E|nr:PREDICTED: uncharacterized protein LOC108379878 isoform X2 [Rhagoletis zephyria]
MKRSSFNKLCGLLSCLERKDTNFRKAISLEKRVAIALYALGSSSEYRSVGNMFGIAKSTVCLIVIEFCKQAWIVLHPVYLNHFPLSREKIRECMSGFNQIGFPQCIGAIDGCHIEIHPKHDDYFIYKGWYSTVLLALVDARYRFLYINVDSPGKCNDSFIYERSLLKQELHNCALLNKMSIQLESVNIPVLILGDSTFRLSPNLMKPFPFSLNNTSAQKKFNYQLSKCRRIPQGW